MNVDIDTKIEKIYDESKDISSYYGNVFSYLFGELDKLNQKAAIKKLLDEKFKNKE